MQCLDILLFISLGWDELHCWLHERYRDSLCVIGIIFLSFDEWFNILRTDHPHVMVELLELSLPIEGSGARFNADGAGRNLGNWQAPSFLDSC